MFLRDMIITLAISRRLEENQANSGNSDRADDVDPESVGHVGRDRQALKMQIQEILYVSLSYFFCLRFDILGST